MTAYIELESVFRRYFALSGASAMLGWDNATMLPENAGAPRGEQMAALAEICHETITQPRLGDLFAKAESDLGNLTDWQQANLREMKRRWQHETCVPADLVTEISNACHESELFWRQARKENNWRDFLPHQAKVLGLIRESAQAKASALNLSAYDALLDQYDPGTTSAMVDVIFDDLAGFLPGFIRAVMEKQASETPPTELIGPFPASVQKQLGKEMMDKLGFDFTRGRLDESTHPFCGGVPGDIRLTTRYNEEDFLSGFFGVMHETGHAMYEMGLPEEWRNQPVGEARGMAFHESQSLLCEMQLTLSHDFLEYACPLMKKAFGVSGAEWSPENSYRLVTRVKPSFIRVDADEATYPAHVILRYRLEKRMIEGKLEAKDLPEAWAAELQNLLGITPPTDADGCMQDIHWPDGAFGYFPTYTLGAMTAAQLMDSARKSVPGLATHIRKGEFAPLFHWLKTNVHSMASKLSSPELLKHATGQTLNAGIYKTHLQNRYLG
ncbi:MAG: carboxypeptidase M32 [Rickettsiales bacterium]|nr:carboxypeptidase M32 [Rickettsiales bacterium]